MNNDKQAVPAWEESLDHRLVERLARPLRRLGVLDRDWGRALHERTRLVARWLPILAKGGARQTAAGYATTRTPIVYVAGHDDPASGPDALPAERPATPQAVRPSQRASEDSERVSHRIRQQPSRRDQGPADLRGTLAGPGRAEVGLSAAPPTAGENAASSELLGDPRHGPTARAEPTERGDPHDGELDTNRPQQLRADQPPGRGDGTIRVRESTGESLVSRPALTVTRSPTTPQVQRQPEPSGTSATRSSELSAGSEAEWAPAIAPEAENDPKRVTTVEMSSIETGNEREREGQPLMGSESAPEPSIAVPSAESREVPVTLRRIPSLQRQPDRPVVRELRRPGTTGPRWTTSKGRKIYPWPDPLTGVGPAPVVTLRHPGESSTPIQRSTLLTDAPSRVRRKRASADQPPPEIASGADDGSGLDSDDRVDKAYRKLDVDELADKVYRKLVRRLAVERERLGRVRWP